MTNRDLIKLLLEHDLDAEASFAMQNGDPIAVENVEENSEEQVVMTGS